MVYRVAAQLKKNNIFLKIWAVPMLFHFFRSIFDFLHPLFVFVESTLLQFIQFSFFLFNRNIASIEFFKSVFASLFFKFYWTVSRLWMDKKLFLFLSVQIYQPSNQHWVFWIGFSDELRRFQKPLGLKSFLLFADNFPLLMEYVNQVLTWIILNLREGFQKIFPSKNTLICREMHKFFWPLCHSLCGLAVEGVSTKGKFFSFQFWINLRIWSSFSIFSKILTKTCVMVEPPPPLCVI